MSYPTFQTPQSLNPRVNWCLSLVPSRERIRATFATILVAVSCVIIGAPRVLSQQSGSQSTPQVTPQGTPQVTPQANWDFGFELFQMLLEERGLRTVTRLEQAMRAPRSSVLVIIGAPPRNFMPADWSNLIRFVQEGGTLLIASESTFNIPNFGDFVQGPVTSKNPKFQYRQQYDDCLVLAAVENAPAPFSTIRQVVTNRSGWFEPNPIGWMTWEPLVTFPDDCRPQQARQQSLMMRGLAAGSDMGGVAIVASDSSIFSNSMLWHGENAVLAIRLSELLCKPEKRQLLFIADRQVQGSYRSRIQVTEPEPDELPQREIPEPELQKALRLANAVAQEVANSNVLNEALRQRPRRVAPENYFRAFIYTVALSLLVGIVWVLVSNRALNAIFLGPRRMRAAFELRDHSPGASSDYRNAAGYLAREFCYELTGSRQTADWQKYLASRVSKLPKLAPADFQELTKLIDIASRGYHAKMSALEFQQFGSLIDRLRAKKVNQI